MLSMRWFLAVLLACASIVAQANLKVTSSMLPASWSQAVDLGLGRADPAAPRLRLTRRGQHYYENHLSLWGLRRMVSAFRIIDYTERVLREPKKFHLEDTVREGSLLHRRVPVAMRALYFACPNYIWLLEKTRVPSSSPAS
jgi:hypothetical protein